MWKLIRWAVLESLIKKLEVKKQIIKLRNKKNLEL